MQYIAIEPAGCRMEDKQTKFQVAPAAHMMTTRIEVPDDVAQVILRGDEVYQTMHALCRAATIGESIEPFVGALRVLLNVEETSASKSGSKRGSASTKKAASAKGATPAQESATSEQTSSSDDGEASDE